MKIKIGEKRLVESMRTGWDRVVTVMSREVHNHREFYRVMEIPGALFLSRSLRSISAQ